MNLLRSIMLSIVASLGLLAAPATARAQVTSGEQNAHFADTPSRADAASLQKKATQAQARIQANKDDRDQLMRAVKTNEVAVGQTSPAQKRIHRRRFGKCEDYVYGLAAEREAKTN